MSEPQRKAWQWVQNLRGRKWQGATLDAFPSAPSRYEPVGQPGYVTISHWGVGWSTLALMGGSYCLALTAALMHLTMFLKLEGRIADSEGIFSQTYVTTMSTFLANIFKTSLCVSLGVAFTQHLWRLLRQRALSVSTIELLFSVRNMPVLLGYGSGWAASPSLYLMAVMMLVLSLAKIFPPGALTVVPSSTEMDRDAIIPTFKSDFVGNGSVQSAMDNSLGTSRVLTSNWLYLDVHPQLQRIAYSTLSSAEIPVSSSPCGPNCTYSTTFEGPYFTCTESSRVEVMNAPLKSDLGWDLFPYFNATRADKAVPDVFDGKEGVNGDEYALFPDFTLEKWNHTGWIEKKDTNASLDYIFKIDTMACQPAYITYDLEVSFNNGIRRLSYSTRDMKLLKDLYNPYAPPIVDDRSNASYVWPPKVLDNLRVINLYALLDSVTQPLVGIFPSYPTKNPFDERGYTEEYTFPNGEKVDITPGSGHAFASGSWDTKLKPNNTIVALTYLNENRDKPELRTDPSIVLSSDTLNDALANVTMAAMIVLPYWSTTVRAKETVSNNVYAFTRPINLFAPYVLSLGLAIPFLILGWMALYENGVPAMDGGFLQLLMTTAGSKELNEAAAGGCLGGNENVPDQLKDLRIRFGELRGLEGIGFKAGGEEVLKVRKAGFGLEHEILPLGKGQNYGI